MRGVYEATINISADTAGKTLMYITAPSSVLVEILDASVTVPDNATSQQLECEWALVTSLGTPTATSITPAKVEQGDQAAASTVKGNVTASEPTYSSTQILGDEGFASIGAWRFPNAEAGKFIIAPSATWGLKLKTTAPTSTGLVARVLFREVG